MTRPRLAAAALLLAAGCPLPQPLPSVPTGSVTPPRIVEDLGSTPPGTINTGFTGATPFDPTSCAVGKEQQFTLVATVADENFSEAVGYRWFGDYDPASTQYYTPLVLGSLDPPAAEPFTLRPVPSLVVYPARFLTPDATHVVDLVVSNGFDQRADQTELPLPYRTPITGTQNYEVQSHRWVFVPVPGCAVASPPTCLACRP